MDIKSVITDDQVADFFVWEGERYDFIASGNCRCVYLSKDKAHVVKIPTDRGMDEKRALKLIREKKYNLLPIDVRHNVLEYIVYKECPSEYRKYLAHTNMLSNCALLQERVHVLSVRGKSKYQIREVGITKNGNIVLFDLDPFFCDGFRLYSIPNYAFLEECIEDIRHKLKTSNQPDQ